MFSEDVRNTLASTSRHWNWPCDRVLPRDEKPRIMVEFGGMLSPVCNSRPSRVSSWWYTEMLVRRHITILINWISGLSLQYGIVEQSSSWRKIWSSLAPVAAVRLWFIWGALAFLCSAGKASLPVLSLVPCSVCGSFENHESRQKYGSCSNNKFPKIRTKREITGRHHACEASLWHKYRVWIR